MTTGLHPLRRDRVYQTAAPTAQLLRELAEIHVLNERLQRRQRLVGYWGRALLVLGVMLAALGLILELFGAAHNPTRAILLIVPGVVLFAVGVAMRYWSARGAMPEAGYFLLEAILELLGTDTAADAPVQVRLDLRRPDAADKFVGKGQVGPWAVKYHTDPWLQLQGQLLDDTKYSLTLSEHFQQRHKSKRNPRGKTKWKSKQKSTATAVLRLKVKPATYAHLQRIAGQAQKAVRLPPWVQALGLELAENELILKTKSKHDWQVNRHGKRTAFDGVQWIALMFLSLYQVLNLSRAISKAEKQGPSP